MVAFYFSKPVIASKVFSWFCVLFSEPEEVEFEADTSLFVIPDHFVIGYGLDCAEHYRNLPYIAEYGG